MTGYEAGLRALLAEGGKRSERERLAAYLDLQWSWEMAEFPERAYQVGEAQPEAGWTDRSPEAVARRHRLVDLRLEVLGSIDAGGLGDRRLDHELARRAAESAAGGRRFPTHLLAVNQLEGPQQEAPLSIRDMPTASVGDYEAIVSRLGLLAAMVAQVQELLAEGLAAGVTPARVALAEVPRQFEALMAPEPRDSPLLAPFASPSPAVAGPALARLSDEAAAVATGAVYPALRRLHDYLVDAYLPACRETVGLRDLPDGEAWYEWAVGDVTAGDLGPAGIHALGLEEVGRIRGEMEAVVAGTGFSGGLTDFFEWIQRDRRFVHRSAEELVAGYRALCKRIDPGLPTLFGTLPRLTYGVEAMPDNMAAAAPAAYYLPGSSATGRAGTFMANTSELESRPTWEMVPLALHEAVPGHHLQIALAQELADLPAFRRHGTDTAYVEGWALYAESLGHELGLYGDPYDRFGSLVFEMWRAARLVVDTGIHYLGWSRRRAIEFFVSQTGRPGHDVAVEIDRYIVWPAQALAYTVGARAIRRLRADAAVSLGPAFDLRRFHDEVLGHGPLPLDVLDREVRRSYVAGGAGP